MRDVDDDMRPKGVVENGCIYHRNRGMIGDAALSANLLLIPSEPRGELSAQGHARHVGIVGRKAGARQREGRGGGGGTLRLESTKNSTPLLRSLPPQSP